VWLRQKSGLLLWLAQVKYCPGFYRDLAPQEKPQKAAQRANRQPNGKIYPKKTGFR
jgi:hypothetical protein